MVRQCAGCLGWCNDFSTSQYAKGPTIRRCVHCIELQRYAHTHNPELIEASRQRVTDRGGDYHNPSAKLFLQDLKATIDQRPGGIDFEELCRLVPYATWWNLKTNMEHTLNVLRQHPNDFDIIAEDHRGEHRHPDKIAKAMHAVTNHDCDKVVYQLKVDKDDWEWAKKNPIEAIDFDEWHKTYIRTDEDVMKAYQKNEAGWKEWDKWYEGWHYFPGKGWQEVDPAFLIHPDNPDRKEKIAALEKQKKAAVAALPDTTMN